MLLSDIIAHLKVTGSHLASNLSLTFESGRGTDTSSGLFISASYPLGIDKKLMTPKVGL